MGALNVQAVDEVALTEVFLPHLLPKHWHGKPFVPREQTAEGPQPDWFGLLWRKLKVIAVSTVCMAPNMTSWNIPTTMQRLERNHLLGISNPRLAVCTPLPVSCVAVLHADVVFGVQDFDNLEHFSKWPLLPTVDGVASLAPLHSSALVREIDAETAPGPAVSALGKLGIRWAICQHELPICLWVHL